MQNEILAIFFRGHFWRLRTKSWAGFMSVAFKGSNGGATKRGGPTPPGNPQTKKVPFHLGCPVHLNIVKNDNFIVNCHDNEYDNDKFFFMIHQEIHKKNPGKIIVFCDFCDWPLGLYFCWAFLRDPIFTKNLLGFFEIWTGNLEKAQQDSDWLLGLYFCWPLLGFFEIPDIIMGFLELAIHN